MGVDKLEKIRGSVVKSIFAVFRFIVIVINLLITFFMLLGALASGVLLYKLFPETALIFLKPLILVLDLFTTLIQASVVLLTFLGVCYLFLILESHFKKLKKKREMERKKFLDEVVGKINEKSRKK